jgi:enoyl-[acyl-carrier protein] reductase II
LQELGRGRYPAAAVKGEVDEGSILAGQICGLINRVQPAAEIIKDLVEDARRVQKRLGA